MIVIFYCILGLIYLAIPLVAKIIVFVINSFIPDPLPAIDEIFMGLFIIRNTVIWTNLSKFQKLLKIFGFVCAIGLLMVILKML